MILDSYKLKRIDNRLINVYTQEDMPKIEPDMYNTVGVLHDGYVYPLRNRTETAPGLYPTNMRYQDTSVYMRRDPVTEKDKEKYSTNDMIDFNNMNSIRDNINKIDELRADERTMLLTVDNIYRPQIHDKDTPEMKAFKYAVGLKGCDINSYKERFGSNYNNDKRLFEKDNITLSKLAYLTDILDMEVDITFKDKNPDVPNPMGKEIKITLGKENSDLDRMISNQNKRLNDNPEEGSVND